MSRIFLWFGLAVLAFGSIAALELKHFGTYDTSMVPQAPLYRVTIDKVPLQVRIADTPEKQAQGLSGTDSLPQDEGMLFAFGQDGTYAFWMKGMNYPIDILWLGADGRIVYMAQNVTPESYPANYRSSRPARYVLEVNAGFVAEHGVALGDIVHFQ